MKLLIQSHSLGKFLSRGRGNSSPQGPFDSIEYFLVLDEICLAGPFPKTIITYRWHIVVSLSEVINHLYRSPPRDALVLAGHRPSPPEGMI